MPEKPITQADLPVIAGELSSLIGKLYNKYQGQPNRMAYSGATSDELVAMHDTWINLHQIGESISHLAEQLDSVYQAQVGAPPENLDFHYVLTEPPATGAEGADIDEQLKE